MTSVGTRVVPGDDGAAHVVMLIEQREKKGTTRTVSIFELRRAGDGWQHFTAWSQPAAIAGGVAKAIAEVAP